MTDVLDPLAATGPRAATRAGDASGGYRLDDRYRRDHGRVFASGVQALARIPLEQLRADKRNGLRTASFVCGYPGSPLAGFDKEAAMVAAIAKDAGHDVVARPGLNEELAATAVMGSQLAAVMDGARYDGVVGIWYGKAPGLDRACDAIRHANFAGTAAHGGVVALVGDDPSAKSSTLPSSSDATLVDLHIPVLYPGDVQEALDLGRHAIALSRASGLWCSLKVVASVADGTGTIELDVDRIRPVIPTAEVGGKPFVPHPSGRLLTPISLDIEREFIEVRLDLARRYGLENDLNTISVDPPSPWIGIIASGYTYYETREALRLLGLRTERDIADAGIRMLQLRLPIPLDPSIIRRFATGLSEIVVVEEKNPTLEWLVKDALYATSSRPVVVGKRDERDERLIPATGGLDADALVAPIRRRLAARLDHRLAPVPAPVITESRRRIAVTPLPISRTPYFCSGCPHNTSTKAPDGALVGAGIGCHGMTALLPPDRVGEFGGLCAMGNEGAQWVGMSPFVERDHFFQNLGDGTLFHSGSLAIRFAVAAGAHITYKILYNGTVAMTGGQHAQGSVSVPTLARMLLLEGVEQVLITTDDVGKYEDVSLPDGVAVWDRERIIEAQLKLAAVKGVTVLIHDQECAAEKRRARKRGKAAIPAKRVVINERICEGCGDCGDKSNCLSVQPVMTPFGRKTRIHQTSCNLDYSCLKGDCPSFATVVTVAGAAARTGGPHPATTVAAIGDVGELPEPERIVDAEDFTIRMPGIGGTGVVTISQVIGTAALLEGLLVRGLDQTGLSQKAGPVVSDLRLTRDSPRPSNKASFGHVDLYLAFDLLVAASDSYLSGTSADRTVVIASTSPTPTGVMVTHPDTAYPPDELMRGRVEARARKAIWVDTAALADRLFGDTTTANVLLLGVAYQHGALPLSAPAIEKAIELNGVAVERNLAAFRRGRRSVVRPLPGDESASPSSALPVETLEERIARYEADLVGYQSSAYARRYRTTIDRVTSRERDVSGKAGPLSAAVAENLYKLMAYKDEYEVARLLLLPEAQEALEAVGGKGAKVQWHLHPPMLKALGVKHKIKLGSWSRPMFVAMARAKRLRGTPLDPFGRAKVRRLERDLIPEYERAIDRLLRKLNAANIDEAAAIASLPDEVRGYEGLKLRRAAAYRGDLAVRLAAYESQE